MADDDSLVLLLRSVNVGGNRMKMPWLRALVAQVGGREVRSVLATGNVIVAMPDDPAALAAAVAEELANRGNRIDVLHRTMAGMRQAVADNPWARDVADGRREGRFVHTMFLDEEPSSGVADEVETEHDGDRWAVVGRHAYVAYDGSSQGSRFQGAWLERTLGVVGTMRNHNTVRRIVDAVAG